MKQKDGGPAFPVSYVSKNASGAVDGLMHFGGMTLRDYFAAKAMQALVASGDEGAGDRITDVPDYAYQIADAMLEARDAD